MAFNKKQIPCLFALFLFSFSIFPLILSVNLDRHGNDIYVTVDPFGEVRGKSFPSQYHKLPNLWINVFLGIPYAKRPSQFGDQWREKFRFMVNSYLLFFQSFIAKVYFSDKKLRILLFNSFFIK